MKSAVPIIRHGRALIAPLHVDLDDECVEVFRDALAEAAAADIIDRVVIDIAGLSFVDTFFANWLSQTAAILRLMGARTFVVGLRPAQARVLAELAFDRTNVVFMSDAEQALEAS